VISFIAPQCIVRFPFLYELSECRRDSATICSKAKQFKKQIEKVWIEELKKRNRKKNISVIIKQGPL